MAEQMIFKRYEVKYMLTKEQFETVVKKMSDHMVPDEWGNSTILSLYFDTPDYLLARRSAEHPEYKEKLRLRSYGVAKGDTKVFIELKKKYDGVVYKRRIGMKETEAMDYLLRDRKVLNNQIEAEIDHTKERYKGIKPRGLLSYEREAFYAKDDHEFRVTFDRNILWREDNVNLTSGVYGESLLKDGQVLMEVKAGGAIPLWFVNILSEEKLYKTSFSKYGTAYKTIFQRSHNLSRVRSRVRVTDKQPAGETARYSLRA